MNVRRILWVCRVVPIANSGPGAPFFVYSFAGLRRRVRWYRQEAWLARAY